MKLVGSIDGIINFFFKFISRIGIGTGEFNINDQRLSGELGILNIPSLCVISQGRVYHFDNQDFTETNIKEFVRKSISMKRFIKIVKKRIFFFSFYFEIFS
jgi:hypothetical protein